MEGFDDPFAECAKTNLFAPRDQWCLRGDEDLIRLREDGTGIATDHDP